MTQLGKILLILGLVLVVVGGVLWGLGKLGFRGLPGDIRIQTEDFAFYFPIVTSIVISIVLTALFWLWNWFSNR